MGGDKLQEVTLGKTKYLYKYDQEKDYLIDTSNNPIKINIRFTRDKAKNDRAKKGLTQFFTEIL